MDEKGVNAKPVENAKFLHFKICLSKEPEFTIQTKPLGSSAPLLFSLSAMLCGSPFALVVVGRPEIILAVHVEVACKKRRKIDVIPEEQRG